MSDSRWPGIRALVNVAGLGGKPIRAGHVGYILAPRLNAAGRIGDAADGLRLLLTDDAEEADTLARALDAVNVRRQAMDEEMLAEAMEEVEATVDLDATYGLVLARERWHPGVVGLVASRVVERLHRPAILVALENESGRGSGRSIPGFDLHAALTQCASHLERFGGHRMAAGVTVRRDRLEAFRAAFAGVAAAALTEEDLRPTQRIDLVVPVGDMSDELERLLRHLEPCGAGNPGPVLGVRGAAARSATTVGAGHVRFTLDDGAARIPAIAFGFADRVPDEWWRGPLDVAVRLERNDWRGSSTLQARVVAVRAAEPAAA
jgi:single-stranded-DNA-specific exonuclease